MKKILFTIISSFGLSYFSFAQWTTSGTNIYNSNTGYVGVGTITPSNKLNVVGNVQIDAGHLYMNSDKFLQFDLGFTNNYNISKTGTALAFNTGGSYTFSGGKVGIGTTTPNKDLDVAGQALIRGTGIFGYNNAGSYDLHIGYSVAAAGSIGTATRLVLQPYGHTGGPWKFDTRDTPSKAFLDIFYGGNGTGTGLTLDNLGNLSIGTPDSRGYKLAVKGNVVAESVTVKLHSAWPDYVFNSTYKLPTLYQVEAYIVKNSHLPGMPSEHEVIEKGIDVGQTNALLLKKVEELTLYLIQQNKQIQQQAARINKLEQQLKRSSK